MAAGAAPAMADRAATGKLAFAPCDRCHPVYVDAQGKPTKPLPNGFEQHQIELEVHDILGEGDKACLACHDDPTRDPGQLILADGSLVDITGDVSQVCQRCHFEKYTEFKLGIHGKHADTCSAAGCHNPHTPSWIYVAPLPPSQGTGFEVNAVGADREAFRPYPGYPVDAHVFTPAWLSIAAALGAVVSGGLLGFVILGRRKR